jgi:hypothetical protein
VTREQQIQAALRLLAPEPERRADCERDINRALNIIEREANAGGNLTKKHKKALRSLEGALRRTVAARRALERHWTTEFGGEHLPPLALDEWIAYCQQQCALPRPRRFRRTANPKYHAVDQAERLLRDWGQQDRISVTRRGRWARLAAVLYGDRRADLYNHLQRYRPFIHPSMTLRRLKTGLE